MEIKLHGCRVYDLYNKELQHQAALALMFRPWPKAPRHQDAENGVRIEIRPEDDRTVIVPDGSKLVTDTNGEQHLNCLIRQVPHALTPNSVNALAELKLHGFQFKE
jgi:hypothetical protein